MQIDIDTNIVRSASSQLLNKYMEYYQSMNSIFSKIGDMPVSTGEWTGTAANRFASNAGVESKQYYKLASNMKDYAIFLSKVANKVDILCREVKKR